MLLWHVTFSLMVSALCESLLSKGISGQERGSGLVFAHSGLKVLVRPEGARKEKATVLLESKESNLAREPLKWKRFGQSGVLESRKESRGGGKGESGRPEYAG